MEQTTIENKVATAVLEKDLAVIEIEGKEYHVAPPTIATLILASEIISHLPIVEKVAADKVVYSVLHHAKDYKPLADLLSVLILGAKGCTEERVRVIKEKRLYGLFWRKKEVHEIIDKKQELSKIILENLSPKVVAKLIIERLSRLEITDFFAITTSLSEANLLKPTKEVEEL